MQAPFIHIRPFHAHDQCTGLYKAIYSSLPGWSWCCCCCCYFCLVFGFIKITRRFAYSYMHMSEIKNSTPFSSWNCRVCVRACVCAIHSHQINKPKSTTYRTLKSSCSMHYINTFFVSIFFFFKFSSAIWIWCVQVRLFSFYYFNFFLFSIRWIVECQSIWMRHMSWIFIKCNFFGINCVIMSQRNVF